MAEWCSDSADLYRKTLRDAYMVITETANKSNYMEKTSELRLHALDKALAIQSGRMFVADCFVILALAISIFYLYRWLKKIKVQYDALIQFQHVAIPHMQDTESKLKELDFEFQPIVNEETTPWKSIWSPKWLWFLFGIPALLTLLFVFLNR